MTDLQRTLVLLKPDAVSRGLAGTIHPAASAFCKHPPRQLPDDEAFVELERFIRGS